MDKRRRVVVTGAGRGVGRATALALAQDHGCEVYAVSRSAAALGSLLRDAGSAEGIIHPVELNIHEADASEHLVASIGDGRLHGLIHNAGVLLRMDMGGYGRTDLEELFRLNVIAPLELSQALASRLSGDPAGHIVHIGSMGGFQDSVKFPGLVAYSSSKAALACMAQCLAEEFKEAGVRSNCLALGAVDTEMLRAAFPGYQAPVSAAAMGSYVAAFVLEGHKLFNGKVLPVAVSTP